MAINIIDYLPIGSAIVSVLSLLIAARLAWVTKLGPPRLVGVASCLLLYTNEAQDGKSIARVLVPRLWLANMGARPMLVTHLRLSIKLGHGRLVELIPDHSIPMEAVDEANTFGEVERVQTGLAPFGGFAVLPGERWVNNYAFQLSADDFESLKGYGTVSFAVCAIGAKRFKTILRQQFDFRDKSQNWLNWVGLPDTGLMYFYPVE